MTRTIKRTRITYLTKTNLAEDFLTQLENLNYELPRQSSFYIVYFYIHTTTYSFLAHIKQFFMRLILRFTIHYQFDNFIKKNRTLDLLLIKRQNRITTVSIYVTAKMMSNLILEAEKMVKKQNDFRHFHFLHQEKSLHLNLIQLMTHRQIQK